MPELIKTFGIRNASSGRVAAEWPGVKRYTRVVVNHKRGPLWGDPTFG